MKVGDLIGLLQQQDQDFFVVIRAGAGDAIVTNIRADHEMYVLIDAEPTRKSSWWSRLVDFLAFSRAW